MFHRFGQRFYQRSSRLYTAGRRQFSAKAGVSQEQLDKETKQTELLTYLTFPVLMGAGFVVYKQHTAHHDAHHEKPRKMPYIAIMNKEFPWSHGDKCTLFDPHCQEKVDGTFEQFREGDDDEAGHEEEGGEDEEEAGGDDAEEEAGGDDAEAAEE